jgi:hypothetical protein
MNQLTILLTSFKGAKLIIEALKINKTLNYLDLQLNKLNTNEVETLYKIISDYNISTIVYL